MITHVGLFGQLPAIQRYTETLRAALQWAALHVQTDALSRILFVHLSTGQRDPCCYVIRCRSESELRPLRPNNAGKCALVAPCGNLRSACGGGPGKVVQ